MKLRVCQIQQHKQFHGIPWNSMEFHGTWSVPIAMTWAISWNSTELEVGQFWRYDEIHQCSHRSPTMKFSDFLQTFSWPSPKFYWHFAAWKYDILTFTGIGMDHTDAKKVIAVIIWWKISTVCHFYFPHQLSYGLIHKTSKCHRNMCPNFFHLFGNGWITVQPHHDIDSHNLG